MNRRLLLTPNAPDGGAITEAPPAPAGYTEAFDAIDSIAGDVFPTPPAETPAPAAKAEPAPVEAKAAEAPKVESASTPKAEKFGLDRLAALDKLKETPAKETATKEPPKEATSLKQFREQYELTKKERDDLAAKLKTLEEAKADGTRKEVEAATAALKKEMEDIRKRNEELDTEVRFLDYTKSQEYKAKFEEPLRDAWKSALDDIDGVTITNDDGTTRPASHHDISALLGMKTAQAAVKAQELFGAAAPEIMVHRRRLIELKNGRETAIKDWREKGVARQSERETEQQNNMRHIHGAFDEEFKSAETDHPALFGRDADDSEANGLLDDGDKLVRIATKGEGLDASMSPLERAETMARAQAHMAVRARAFGRERLRVIRLQRENEDLKKKLEGITKSEPGSGSGARSERTAPTNPEDAIDALPSGM
jgi:hypothetical protein